jgi:two-component system response regulator YesN
VFTLSGCRSIADLDDLLRKLCRDILSRGEPERDQTHPVIREIIGYMHQHYAEPTLSMSAFADAYGISAVRLSLDFKELSGMTPSEYLLLLRMEKAKELLGGTRMPVKDIGMAVGYYDASGFIRRFRQHMAMTPAQYRQMIGQKESTSMNVQE